MADRFILGWEEWLSLPDLGLPAIKAKVDTGARTSALHAFTIEPFGSPSKPMVRFGVHPIPGRDDVEIYCTAEVLDRREVTSSNGEREQRYVISSRVQMGERVWPIEVTLANRDSMAYRMLLGRQAIKDDMFVDPTSSFRQPRLGYRVYGRPARTAEGRQALRIALITRQPESASNRRLARAAEQRGHTLISVDRTRVSLFVDTAQPAILVDGHPLADVD
ncbi:MAG: ATP-dependent zinc protease, partial [Rhodospirillales bacterium]|nr:ATP-dependent zinc protease [Rhodospirillales bacterium]